MCSELFCDAGGLVSHTGGGLCAISRFRTGFVSTQSSSMVISGTALDESGDSAKSILGGDPGGETLDVRLGDPSAGNEFICDCCCAVPDMSLMLYCVSEDFGS